MNNLVGTIGPAGMLFYTALGFLFVLSVVVFFHELGHFLVARWFGVAIKAFSLGFGPEIVGFNDRYGTRWKLSWIPLGGYVKFIDDENVASAGQKSLDHLSPEERKGSLQGKSLGARAAVVAAGPIANFILAVVIFTLLSTFVGDLTTAAKVDVVTPGSAAERAGFLPGDLVISIDGQPINNFAEMQQIVSASPGVTLTFEVNRQGKEIELRATPEIKDVTDRFGNKYQVAQLGIRRNANPDEWSRVRHDPITSFGLAIKQCYQIVERSLSYLVNVARGREPPDQLGGPIRIAQISGQVASLGFIPLLNLAALLSVSIGLLNLFPIPMLDGGHLLFYAIEAVRGRPLSERSQEIGFRIGLALVLMLLLFVTKNDLMHLFFS